MSYTEIQLPKKPSTEESTSAPQVLAPKSSQIGLMRPDHSKSVIIDWLTTVDHKKIGLMYGAIALFFLLVGGLEALIIRTQLAIPENDLISAQRYNQLFTMHGTTMIFLAIVHLGFTTAHTAPLFFLSFTFLIF